AAGVVAGLVERDDVHRQLAASGADELRDLSHLDAEFGEGEVLETDVALVEEVGGDHRVEGRVVEGKATAVEYLEVVLGVVGDHLQRRVGQHRVQGGSHVVQRELRAVRVADGNVVALRGVDRDRDADELRQHRIGRGAFDVDGVSPRFADAFDETGEVLAGSDDGSRGRLAFDFGGG